jgi:hypothetical protein
MCVRSVMQQAAAVPVPASAIEAVSVDAVTCICPGIVRALCGS